MDRIGITVDQLLDRLRKEHEACLCLFERLRGFGCSEVELHRYQVQLLRTSLESMVDDLEDLEAALSMSTNCPQSSGGMQLLRGAVFGQAAENDG